MSDRRRSARGNVLKSYGESPIESPTITKPRRKSIAAATPAKTPTKRKSRAAMIMDSDEDEEFVPKSAAKAVDVSPKKRRSVRPKTPTTKGLESIVTESSPSVDGIERSGGRRSGRKRKQAILTPQQMSMKDQLSQEEESFEKINLDASNGSNEENVDFNIQKPTTLFDDKEDVEGKSMISFKTPKKHNSMAMLAQLTPKTPRHDKGTPKRLSEVQKTPTSRPSAHDLVKTPKHVRDETKKKLGKKLKQIVYESDDDFSSASSDEFQPDRDTSSSDDSDDDSDDEKEDEKPKKPTSVSARLLKTPATSLGRGRRNQKDFQFVLRADDYFSSANSKSKTSDHTLDRLKNPRLPHDQLIKMLANMELSAEHKKSVKSLNEEHKLNFDKWLTLMDEGFTVLLHGLGSKRNLLQNFHKEKLANQHVVVVNGFFPSLTIKDILDSILEILELTATGSPHEVVAMIEDEMKEIPSLNLFLMVHNLEGSMLRNDRAQSVLSRLASIRNLHMIASIDHINTPLIWNNTKLSNYNFIWFDVTTFLPYIEETSFENSFLVQNSGTLELSSMKSVFQSLTTNARKIYILVVKNQLKNNGNPNFQGISFKELYNSSRSEFLVSSDVALRAQLTEFLDHKLAKMKRTIDGAENITIPLKNSLLEQFLNEQC